MSDWQHADVPPEDRGTRLDAWLAKHDDSLSRVRWQQLVREGHVTVNSNPTKPNVSLKSGDQVSYRIPEPEITELIPEDIPLDILFEDASLIAVNKSAGMVVHPAPGHPSGTLVNALLFHCKDLAGIGGEIRPGIVHRLDMDTTGVILVAKTENALRSLQAQFKNRETRKIYEALVIDCPNPDSGTIDSPIGRHPTQRKKMQADARNGRSAITHYRTLHAYRGIAHLELRIETGRTHQIRVHMASLRHPVLGDALYGKQRSATLPITSDRQLLHAKTISFTHPESGENMTLTAPLPKDMVDALTQLQNLS